MAEIYGNNTVSQLAPRRVHRPNAGWTTERRFRGTIQALNFEASAILAATPSVEIQIDPPQDDAGEGLMTVRFPDAQDGAAADASVLIVWGCPNQTRERAIIEHPKFDAISNANDKKLLSKYYKGTVTTPLVSSGDTQSFSDCIERGEMAYLSNVFTLRVSMSAPSSWTVPNLQQYVDVVFTRGQIIDLFNPPDNILTQMPESPNEGEYLCTRAELEQTDKGGWHVVIEWAHSRVAWSFVYTRWT